MRHGTSLPSAVQGPHVRAMSFVVASRIATGILEGCAFLHGARTPHTLRLCSAGALPPTPFICAVFLYLSLPAFPSPPSLQRRILRTSSC